MAPCRSPYIFMDFIYERFKTPDHIKIETVTGGSRYKGKVWLQIALQIYCENGKEGYREIGHFSSGAPFLFGSEEKISISHTERCLAVATLPEPAPLGIDVERADREKVMGLRERFLTEEEQKIVARDSIEANIIAWTCKEAMLKAGMDPKIDWHHNIIINALPSFESPGSGFIRIGEETISLRLATMIRDGFIISTATI